MLSNGFSMFCLPVDSVTSFLPLHSVSWITRRHVGEKPEERSLDFSIKCYKYIDCKYVK